MKFHCAPRADVSSNKPLPPADLKSEISNLKLMLRDKADDKAACILTLAIAVCCNFIAGYTERRLTFHDEATAERYR